jgi:hypothetical protein
MESGHRKALNRATAETAVATNASRDSCADTARHIENSREAIARSLRLLGKRFHQMDD